jgi:hypothetical protein
MIFRRFEEKALGEYPAHRGRADKLQQLFATAIMFPILLSGLFRKVKQVFSG